MIRVCVGQGSSDNATHNRRPLDIQPGVGVKPHRRIIAMIVLTMFIMIIMVMVTMVTMVTMVIIVVIILIGDGDQRRARATSRLLGHQ